MGPTGSWIIGSNPPYFAIRNSWTLAPASSLGRLEDHTEPLLTLLPTGAWPLAALAPATLQGVHIVLSAPSTRRSPKFAPLHAVCHRAPLSRRDDARSMRDIDGRTAKSWGAGKPARPALLGATARRPVETAGQRRRLAARRWVQRHAPALCLGAGAPVQTNTSTHNAG